jgi:hemerythrin
LLITLLVHTRQHFAAEEEMLAAANYPGLIEHRIKHRAFAEQFEDYVARYQRGDTTLRNDFASFFSGWLNAHLQNVEAYVLFFNERGHRSRMTPLPPFEQRDRTLTFPANPANSLPSFAAIAIAS